MEAGSGHGIVSACFDSRIGVSAGGRHCANGDLADLATDRPIGPNSGSPDVSQNFRPWRSTFKSALNQRPKPLGTSARSRFEQAMWGERQQYETSGAWPAQRDEPEAVAVPSSSLTRTGLFNWFQRTLQLGDTNNPRTAYRAFLFAIVSWLPLVALAGAQRLAINDDPRKSLLLDFTVHARFLVAIPFFILGGSIADRKSV